MTEHLEFLEKALIPLQKPRGMMLYYNELLYCTLQYIEKDANASLPVVRVRVLALERASVILRLFHTHTH